METTGREPIESANQVARGQSAHRRIYGDLIEEIAAGRYEAEAQLPTEHELIATYGVSRATVSRAMQELARDGIVVRRRGAGTFLARPRGGEAAGDVLTLFVPFLTPDEPLPHVEGQMRHFVVEGAARTGFLPRIQPLAGGADLSLEQRFSRAVDQVLESRARAVLFYPAELPAEQTSLNRVAVERLDAAGIEVLLVDRDIVQPPARSRFLRIGYDNRLGAARLTTHLVEQGCRRLAFVGLAAESSSVKERLQGFRNGLREPGVPDTTAREWRVVNPTRALVEEILHEFQADGIICKSDRFAAEVARHLHAMGVEIGREVMLAGFDDDPIAALLPVSLTTVRLNAQAFAEAAIHCVQARLANTMPRQVQLLIDCEVVVRGSTRGGSVEFTAAESTA